MSFLKNIIKKIVPPFLIDYYHFSLPFLGAVLYGFPSGKLFVIGVTGTKGKSTAVDFTSGILEEAGHKVASLSSIRFKIGNKEWPNDLKMTMPGRLKIQKFLKQAVDAGCKYAVLEITSEGIKQHRHRFIDFKAAVFTNLAPEHIESHGGFENYRAAKGKLFRAAKNIHIINLDDENAGYFLEFPAKEKLGYRVICSGRKDSGQYHELVCGTKTVGAEILGLTPLRFSIINTDINTEFGLKLLGEFNIYNALAAICVGLSQGVSLEVCKKALEKIEGIPGRMEVVIKEPFTAIVDYAHTPDALESVYKTIQDLKSRIPDSRMICVLGSAGGGRDKWKRPKMGEIAAKYCDEVILTNEDPYDENPDQILENIEEGVLKIKNLKLNKNLKFKIKNYQKILDRREAIRKALNLANHRDAVIITGKGCEPWVCVANGKKIPWDDRQIVREERQKQEFKPSV